MPGGVAGVELAELGDEVGPLGSRADQAHVTAQDVEQLRQLVQRGPAQDAPDRAQPVVVGDVPVGLRLGLVERPQGAELHQLEGHAVAADAFLAEDDALSGFPSDGEGDQGQQRREQHERAGREHDVDQPLHAPGEAAVRRAAEPDQRQITHRIHVVARRGSPRAAGAGRRPRTAGAGTCAPWSTSSASSMSPCATISARASDADEHVGQLTGLAEQREQAAACSITRIRVDEPDGPQTGLRMPLERVDHRPTHGAGADDHGRMRHPPSAAGAPHDRVRRRTSDDDRPAACRAAASAACRPVTNCETTRRKPAPTSHSRMIWGRSSSTDNESRARLSPPKAISPAMTNAVPSVVCPPAVMISAARMHAAKSPTRRKGPKRSPNQGASLGCSCVTARRSAVSVLPPDVNA